MKADYIPGSGQDDEIWSNWICPQCKEWWGLGDYIVSIEESQVV